jgi:hypothetical protein
MQQAFLFFPSYESENSPSAGDANFLSVPAMHRDEGETTKKEERLVCFFVSHRPFL